MLKIPTVDDWYCLSLKYRQFHRVSDTSLKDYGGKGARANWRKDHETATVRAGRKGLRSDVNRDSATLPREKDGPRPRCRAGDGLLAFKHLARPEIVPAREPKGR